jgi:hypothetical protein
MVMSVKLPVLDLVYQNLGNDVQKVAWVDGQDNHQINPSDTTSD